MIVCVRVGPLNVKHARKVGDSRGGRGERWLQEDYVVVRHAVVGRQEELARRADNENFVEEAEEPGLFVVETPRVRSEEHVVRDGGPQPRFFAVERLAGEFRASGRANERTSERATERGMKMRAA